ncbi:MAG: hypothetical protein Q8O98_00075 [bacterium]|nr:hypothetical protein [bacterium]
MDILTKRIIVVATSLIVVGLFLGTSLFGNVSILSDLITKPETREVAQEKAWSSFERYITFSKAHDIEGVKSLSHQVSPACADVAREEECITLMESVAFFTGSIREEDITHVESDRKQIVMWTDYIDGNRTILYFTRESGGEPKVLGIRFCGEGESSQPECLDDGNIRDDTNNNGWWDVVEALFR